MKASALLKPIFLILAMTLYTAASPGSATADGAMAHQLIANAVNQFNAVADYTCRLNKKVRKNNKLYTDRDIAVKYKKPGHYYFRWESGIARGREVIFVRGKNNDKIMAHPGGILKFMTFRLDPAGYLAMKENRHCLKSSGMEKIIALLKSNTALAGAKGLDVIRFAGENRFDGKRVLAVEGRFPENHGFYAHMIRLCFCPTIKLPLKVSIYDWSGRLVEDYEFHDLKINVGLSDHDFDPHNAGYSFAGS